MTDQREHNGDPVLHPRGHLRSVSEEGAHPRMRLSHDAVPQDRLRPSGRSCPPPVRASSSTRRFSCPLSRAASTASTRYSSSATSSSCSSPRRWQRGLAMALDNRFKWYQRLFGKPPDCRSMHFIVMVSLPSSPYTCSWSPPPSSRSNLNGITLGVNEYQPRHADRGGDLGHDRLPGLGGELLLDAHAVFLPADLESDRRTGDGPAV